MKKVKQDIHSVGIEILETVQKHVQSTQKTV